MIMCARRVLVLVHRPGVKTLMVLVSEMFMDTLSFFLTYKPLVAVSSSCRERHSK